ncbi:MAG TPA: DUF2073 domain-containing protein [Candidatus Syntrophoarchaeum butanivorans]|uniref:DUF2073 domain-containing protein n=1 Tax=Candidatus Syntropharchaeum butanivorans TaxID=1839936 RepID=A0A1F2P5N1_9EURY|nr:MAG: Uncharacterized conserved protein UCP004977 [Candidatus Syntrophoarchaeum butanivorans]RJS70845.1 MAG: DUF2073 domain-containing protein [Candidatus Syntrophoarchaeum sp. WYZ-LMO15]HDM36133.1 DUF2073 domain-containing protein [Candidatus Syntrophoarchaeum butanivorans]HEC57002.1 DUF2073 domain-containing protein [Candidatus Syntrophoarchaeum butanivorans]
MKSVQLDLISYDMLSGMTPMEKIRMILDRVRDGAVVILERGLTPEEEAKLIEYTMTEIEEDFPGIEIESYPSEAKRSWIGRILGKGIVHQPRLTIIGPAEQLKTTSKDRDFISAVISMKDE